MRKKFFCINIFTVSVLAVSGSFVLAACGSDSSVANNYTQSTEIKTTSTTEETTTTQQTPKIIADYQLIDENSLAEWFSEKR